MHHTYASLKSIAAYIPPHCVSNTDFEKIIDTSDEWITERTGIKTRYFADASQTTSDLAYEAGKVAIQRAGLTPQDIDIVIVSTLSGDYLSMPSTACLTSFKLGIENKPAFDISAACSGFIYLLGLAKSFIESKTYKNILIIGAERISSILDFTDRNTCVLFGDGAGACVIGATNDPKEAILEVDICANGRYENLLYTPRQCTTFPQLTPKPPKRESVVHMEGKEIFKLAVKTLTQNVNEILAKHQLSAQDVNFFVPHQANLRIINAVGKQLNFTPEQIVLTVQKYSNTSAASIPMAINDIYESSRLKYGDLMLLDAFGGGLTWGSALVRFALKN